MEMIANHTVGQKTVLYVVIAVVMLTIIMFIESLVQGIFIHTTNGLITCAIYTNIFNKISKMMQQHPVIINHARVRLHGSHSDADDKSSLCARVAGCRLRHSRISILRNTKIRHKQYRFQHAHYTVHRRLCIDGVFLFRFHSHVVPRPGKTFYICHTTVRPRTGDDASTEIVCVYVRTVPPNCVSHTNRTSSLLFDGPYGRAAADVMAVV